MRICESKIWTLFRCFFYLSAVTLGGGLAMLPMMRVEFVERRHWMSDDEMVDTVAAMQSMPGIIATNMGVLIGYRIAGVTGAFAAVAGAVLPPFIAIVALSSLVAFCRQWPVVKAMFLGVRAAVTALILLAVIGLCKKIISGRRIECLAAVIIATASFIAIYCLDVNALWVIATGALIGVIYLPLILSGEKKP